MERFRRTLLHRANIIIAESGAAAPVLTALPIINTVLLQPSCTAYFPAYYLNLCVCLSVTFSSLSIWFFFELTPGTKHSRPSTKHSRNFHDPTHMAGKTDKIKSTSLCIVLIALVAILITISSERTFIAYYANNSVVSLYSREGSSLDQEQDVRSQYLRLMQHVGDTLDHQAKRIEELDCKIVDLEAAMMEMVQDLESIFLQRDSKSRDK